MRAPTDTVADAIRSGGLANTKAPRIQEILREVKRREGAYDLSRLTEMTDREARDYLTSLPGIGPKTAAVVLSFALGRDALPVDTHVLRVSRRLGLIPPKTSAERADRMLHALVPDGLRTSLHVALIRWPRDLQGAGAALSTVPTEGSVSDGAEVSLTERAVDLDVVTLQR